MAILNLNRQLNVKCPAVKSGRWGRERRGGGEKPMKCVCSGRCGSALWWPAMAPPGQTASSRKIPLNENIYLSGEGQVSIQPPPPPPLFDQRHRPEGGVWLFGHTICVFIFCLFCTLFLFFKEGKKNKRFSLPPLSWKWKKRKLNRVQERDCNSSS